MKSWFVSQVLPEENGMFMFVVVSENEDVISLFERKRWGVQKKGKITERESWINKVPVWVTRQHSTLHYILFKFKHEYEANLAQKESERMNLQYAAQF